MSIVRWEQTVSLVSKTSRVPSVSRAMLVLEAFVRIVACIPSLCPMSIVDVPMEQIPFYKYTIFAIEHHVVWDPVLVENKKKTMKNGAMRHCWHVFDDHAYLEWHCIYAPISTRDYSSSVYHPVLSNFHLVLNNFQMQDPSSWQHLHTNPRIDLFYQFFRRQSVTEIHKKVLTSAPTHTHTHTRTVKTTVLAELLSRFNKWQRSVRDTRKFFPCAIYLLDASILPDFV